MFIAERLAHFTSRDRRVGVGRHPRGNRIPIIASAVIASSTVRNLYPYVQVDR